MPLHCDRQIVSRSLRNRFRRAYDSFYCVRLPGKVQLGTVDHWNVYLPALSAASIVYSGGVGKDITFEHALIARVGCCIQVFDPSDTGIATMARPENRTPNLSFHPIGLAASSGTFRFASPLDPHEGSYFQVASGEGGGSAFACESLAAAMLRLGHRHIDLLKLDVEGAEYGVIENIYEHALEIKQLCLEFHPRMYGNREAAHRRALRQLKEMNFLRIHRERNDFTFIHRSLL